MNKKTTNENLVNNIYQSQTNEEQIINELKINKMSIKDKIENLVNHTNYSQNKIIKMKEELNELNTTIEETELQMDELEYESDEYGELQKDIFIHIKLRDMIENQLERHELKETFSEINHEIYEIESYIDDYNTGELQNYQGDTSSMEFEMDLMKKEEEILPVLQEKSEKIWNTIQELKEQFESIKNQTL